MARHTAWHEVAQWPGMFAVDVMPLLKSSAARAAHRELRSLLRLFRASNARDRRARPFCLFGAIS
ncbi:hypothetical protein, partial [Pseudomonas putida]|uniref:hypothetical protein n=1 Tax=Pseudomonas putida TaxID=303 RepID=UPI001EE080E0